MKLFTYIFLPVLLSNLFINQANAQTDDIVYHPYPDKVKVYDGNGEQTMAWCGGVNNPQFAMADLNRDGKNDLVIFEKGGYVRTFLNIGNPGETKYRYAPAYEKNFPVVYSYAKLLDYNNDQIPDLWRGGAVTLCKGYYNQANELAFEQCKDVKYTDKNGNLSNIPVQSDFMPDMQDVDGDGDIDIITYHYLGNRVMWFRNFQKEMGNPDDVLNYRYVDNCWGRFLQIESIRKRALQYYCDNSNLKPSGESQNRTTGGAHAICLFDADGDKDFDVLDGTNSGADIQYLENSRTQNGNKLDSMIAQDTLWQSNGTKLLLRNFPIAFWLDIDNDGDRDLLFSPFSPGENYRCITFYRNNGSDNNPSFGYQTDTLFMDKMIDLGKNSYPLIYDYNKDGKPDLIAGSSGYYQPTGLTQWRLSLYTNTGTASDPALTLQTTDFLDISLLGMSGSAPAAGDIDGDGLDDLVIGQSDGTLRFFQNFATSVSVQPVWKLKQQFLSADGNTIDVGSNAVPFIYDFDKDGDKDLIIGNTSGKLSYYENTGAGLAGSPSLKFITDFLGNVNVKTGTSIFGYSAPYAGKIDNTGSEYLLVGNQSGIISRYAIQHGNATATFARLDSVYSNIHAGGINGYAAPSIGDIDGDGQYEMVIGNEYGGFYLYQQLFNVNVEEVTRKAGILKLYPNPAQNHLIAEIPATATPADISLRIYNSMGVQVRNIITSRSGNELNMDISMLPAAMYICTLTSGNRTYTATFIKK